MTRAFLFIFGSLVAPVALFSKRQPPNACRFFLLTPGLHPTHPTFSPCVSGPQVSCSFDTAMYFRTAKHSTTSVAVTAIAQRPSGTPLNAIPSTARRSLKCQAGSNDGRRMGTSSEGEECLSTPGRQLGRRTTLSALLGTASFAAAAAAGALEGDQELETSPPGAAAR